MVAVIDMMVKLAQLIDVRDKNNVEITAANVATAEGQYTAQRRLDIYNTSRMMVFLALKQNLPTGQFSEDVGATVKTGNIVFQAGVAPKPADYVDFIGASKGLIPVIKLRESLRAEVRKTTNPHFLQDAANMFMFEANNQFETLDAANVAGTVVLDYWGLADWTLADLTAIPTKYEVFRKHYPLLLEVAEGLHLGQGSNQLQAMIMTFIGRAR